MDARSHIAKKPVEPEAEVQPDPKPEKKRGRPSTEGLTAKQKKVLQLEKALDRHFKVDKVVKALNALALGVTVEKSTKDGPVIYTEKPDREAGEVLLSRKFGKPVQQIQEDITHRFADLTPEEIQKLPTHVLNEIIHGDGKKPLLKRN
jgi:hypothetical protein